VLIPVANVKHLMLREDVVEAVKANRFQVYPVDHVDQALAVLSGEEAGEKDKNGEFPKGSINFRVRERLLELAEKRRAFGKSESNEDDTANESKSS
ncbi:MAG: ATP-dependent protease, partial [Gammaproteobacteria bacterium]|nr:ATP-dependent protease [Gammaproteobacteria bacterium]